MNKTTKIKVYKAAGYLTTEEAAKMIGIKSGGSFVRSMRNRGIYAERIGNCWMYRKSDIVKYLETKNAANAYIDRQTKSPELPLGWVDAPLCIPAKQAGGEMICKAAKTCTYLPTCPHMKPHKANWMCAVKCAHSGGKLCVHYKPDEKPAVTPPAPLDAEAVRSIVREEIAAAVKKIREAMA